MNAPKQQKFRLTRAAAGAGMMGGGDDLLPLEEMVIALPEGAAPPDGAEAVPANTNVHGWRPVDQREP